jgi:hypothetical protein
MRIYICHPYGRRHGLSDEMLEENALRAIEWGRKLIEMGHNPFIPNLYHFVHKGWDFSPDEDFWLNLVSHWLLFCDAVFVAEKPKWKGSGVQYEIDMAHKIGIPVYYSLEEIPFGR